MSILPKLRHAVLISSKKVKLWSKCGTIHLWIVKAVHSWRLQSVWEIKISKVSKGKKHFCFMKKFKTSSWLINHNDTDFNYSIEILFLESKIWIFLHKFWDIYFVESSARFSLTLLEFNTPWDKPVPVLQNRKTFCNLFSSKIILTYKSDHATLSAQKNLPWWALLVDYSITILSAFS